MMDLSNSACRPPTLDSSVRNYAWKARMRMFIKSIDERAWVVVLDGWRPPRVIVDDVPILKPESEWTADERTISNFNSNALNVIFVSVDVASFCMISNCTEAREAWNILQEQCEGTESVKQTKLRLTQGLRI